MSNSIYRDVHSERRSSPRSRVQLKAQLRSNNRQLTVEVLDLSKSGMAIRSTEILPSDLLVDLTMTLPTVKEAVTCEAKILWSDGRGRAGLQFVDLHSKVGTVIDGWMSKHTLTSAV